MTVAKDSPCTLTLQIDEAALDKRHEQGWITDKTSSLDELVKLIRHYKRVMQPAAIGYHGNIVDVW